MKTKANIRPLKTIDELVEKINRLHKSISMGVEVVRERSKSVLENSIECGKRLVEAKARVGHGNWQDWLKANCPDIGQVTAWRYMKLANLSLVKDLTAVDSLKEAYALAGIISDKTGIAAQEDAETPAETLSAFEEPETKEISTDLVRMFLKKADIDGVKSIRVEITEGKMAFRARNETEWLMVESELTIDHRLSDCVIGIQSPHNLVNLLGILPPQMEWQVEMDEMLEGKANSLRFSKGDESQEIDLLDIDDIKPAKAIKGITTDVSITLTPEERQLFQKFQRDADPKTTSTLLVQADGKTYLVVGYAVSDDKAELKLQVNAAGTLTEPMAFKHVSDLFRALKGVGNIQLEVSNKGCIKFRLLEGLIDTTYLIKRTDDRDIKVKCLASTHSCRVKTKPQKAAEAPDEETESDTATEKGQTPTGQEVPDANEEDDFDKDNRQIAERAVATADEDFADIQRSVASVVCEWRQLFATIDEAEKVSILADTIKPLVDWYNETVSGDEPVLVEVNRIEAHKDTVLPVNSPETEMAVAE